MASYSAPATADIQPLARPNSESPNPDTLASERADVWTFVSRVCGRITSSCRAGMTWITRDNPTQGCADLATGATMLQPVLTSSMPATSTLLGTVEYHFDQIDREDVMGTPYEICLSEGWDDLRRDEILRSLLLRTLYPDKLIQYEEISGGVRIWPSGQVNVSEGVIVLAKPTSLRSHPKAPGDETMLVQGSALAKVVFVS